MVRTDTAHPDATPNADPPGLGPADLQGAYNLPSSSAGSGQTVAIVDAMDDPNAESDLAQFRSTFGLPACTTANGCFRKVNQNGQASPLPQSDVGWATEISLDVDMVSAVCPNCDILLVESNTPSFNDLGTAVNTAVRLGAKYVSNSYGGSEGAGEGSIDAQFYDHPGVAVTASSGDSGFGVSIPAAFSHVVAVGGTSLRPSSTARGWTESAWSGAGSGCSGQIAKPSWQNDTGCSRRTVADVSAVADPNTGVAVFDTFGQGGFLVVGGTSASAPIIAGVYALAGIVGADDYPNTYPYANSGALRDITSGANGECEPAYLCTAVAGFDGPTGWGTPNGVAGFAPPGDFGDLTGTVTDAATGEPVAGATVSVGTKSSRTDPDGHYDVFAPVGAYDLSVSAFGYQSTTVAEVTVVAGQRVTVDVPLAPSATGVISGTVTDGGGHGWPLHAKVTLDGGDGGDGDLRSTWSDPFTGHYEIDVPADTYTLTVSPDIPGYQVATRRVVVTGGDVNANVPVVPDPTDCSAPGYDVPPPGEVTSFDNGLPDGWTVTDNAGTGSTWVFDDPADRGNRTGGGGGFAIVDSDHDGFVAQDTSHRSDPAPPTGCP